MNISSSFSPILAVKNNALKPNVSFGHAQEISDAELNNIKKDIEQTLTQRHFSPKLIKEVVTETDKDNYEVVSILAKDQCCHSSTIRNVMPAIYKKTHDLFKKAALYRDYEALYGIANGEIKDFSKIRYMKDINNKVYRPTWTHVMQYSENEMRHYKQFIVANLIDKNFRKDEIAYLLKYVDNESVMVIKTISKSNARPDIIRFAAENANVENSELMHRAMSYDDYDAIFGIALGKIRTAQEIDDRAEEKYKDNTRQSQYSQSHGKSSQTESQSRPQSTGRITKEQFIEIVSPKLNHVSFQMYQLKDSEIRNLAKLLGTTTNQITNMDKSEFRRLIKKFHHDENKTDPHAKTCYEFVKTLYDKSPQKGK